MEAKKDLSKLYDAIFQNIDILKQEFPSEESDSERYRWVYIGHFYPWLIFQPMFAQLFFNTESRKNETFRIHDGIYEFFPYAVEKGIMNEEEVDTFMRKVTYDQMVATGRKYHFYSPGIKFLIAILYIMSRENIGKLLSDLDVFHIIEQGSDDYTLRMLIIDESISNNDVEIFRELVNKICKDIYTTTHVFQRLVTLAQTPKNAFFDILYDQINKGSVTYNYMFDKILDMFYRERSNVSFLNGLANLFKWMSLHSKEPLENIFNGYHQQIYEKFFYIGDKQNLLMFYQALYLAGLPYEVFVQTNEKYNLPVLTEWLQGKEDV